MYLAVFWEYLYLSNCPRNIPPPPLCIPAVDGESTEWRPRRASDSGRPCVTGECEAGRGPEEGRSEDDLQFWDFCTPASLEALQQGGDTEAEAVTLPANLGDSGSGYNPGGGRRYYHGEDIMFIARVGLAPARGLLAGGRVLRGGVPRHDGGAGRQGPPQLRSVRPRAGLLLLQPPGANNYRIFTIT